MLKKLGVGVAMLTLGAAIAGCGSGAPSKPPVATLAEYDQVKDGMSYQEVLKIVGEPETSKLKEPDPKVEKWLYMWSNSDGSSMSVSISQDKVVARRQNALK